MSCYVDDGLGFRNTFSQEAAKLGVRVEHSSTYNSSSQAPVETGVGVGSLKSLLKRCGSLTQLLLQIHEMVSCVNNWIQPGGTESPIAGFLGRNMRITGIPNSLDRDLQWKEINGEQKSNISKQIREEGENSERER